MKTRLRQCALNRLLAAVVICLAAFAPLKAIAAPYAAFVIDVRSGKVLHARNADTRLHPASLTKMMTLYVTFEAIKHGEITLDTMVTISKHAASQPPSKLGLRAGQKIKLRYLIRATAVKSANDAAAALGEAISGSVPAFARRMNRTAKALGMSRTTFKNMHGLTKSGHLSTARDMTSLGRHLFFDYPDYYNLFSRVTTDAGVRQVLNTNRKLLSAYSGADGIKTGYTRAAGYNLVASARRGNERIIATVFGGRSTATRNAKVAELLDLGFRRAPGSTNISKPSLPQYSGNAAVKPKVIRHVMAVKTSLRPPRRPSTAPSKELLLAMKTEIQSAVAQAQKTTAPKPATIISTALAPKTTLIPTPRPSRMIAMAAAKHRANPAPQPKANRVVVTRLSTSGGRMWGVNVGRYGSQHQAERMLLKTALKEMTTLDGALRKVVRRKSGYDANFVGMSRKTAELACRRLQARDISCSTMGPS